MATTSMAGARIRTVIGDHIRCTFAAVRVVVTTTIRATPVIAGGRRTATINMDAAPILIAIAAHAASMSADAIPK
jgi:hypothetical protein